ncbi:MAG: HNH endonuclease [Hydrogenophaga sp.]|uniref:HNH endonuclease n=1 Tax=Hydrogenophaga sp. TaxID=1904254 RepID=UPI0027373AE5|nr:HNH endonuclease [Hydrogenophaga sp.]MDP3351814.1 HNH endonuclease [Hydrogenophaga sp.]
MRTAPIGFLLEALDYDPLTGSLKWRSRPRSHFDTDRGWRTFNSKFAGQEAGCVYTSTGYRVVNLGRYGFIGAHRIAFAMVHGSWVEFVDHRNRRPLDNWITNLRESTKAQNCRNRRRNRNTASGFKGVSKAPHQRRWQARIEVDGQQIHLGMFDSPEEAHGAYAAAAAQHHGEFACPN